MSHTDQCPSTTKGPKQRESRAELAALKRDLPRIAGKPVWRSLDEAADSGAFRDFLEREFPAGASELSRATAAGGETRRDFLKYMGASIALAGAATLPGCRRPDHKIMPYSSQVPEEIIPGKPLFYATSMPRPDGGAEGLLVETHEGRPTKIEGNPLHPHNRGKASVWALASILSLYDPDRLKGPEYQNPVKGRLTPLSPDGDRPTWDDFRAWAADHFKTYDAARGDGLAFIIDKCNSPTRTAMKARILARWPKAQWIEYRPAESLASIEGTRLAFGSPMREHLNFSKQSTRVILSLDRDFLCRESDEVPNGRGFASTREVWQTTDEMSRLYAVEGAFSLAGAAADHRLRLAPSQVASFAVALAREVLGALGGGETGPLAQALAQVAGLDTAGIDGAFLSAVKLDLLDAANRGKSLILAGPTLPPEIHALVCALNAALGNIGNSIRYSPMDADDAANSLAGIGELASRMKSGAVKTLVCVGTNPVYDAPGDLDFAALYQKIPATICLSVGSSETAAASTWALNASSYLESWGDTLSTDGTLAPIQPMIAPLYEPSMSAIEFLALLASTDPQPRIDGYELVREQWRTMLGDGASDRAWRRALHDGLLANSGRPPEGAPINFAAVSSALAAFKPQPAPTQSQLDVAFTVGNLADGRFANITWLQELPENGTRTVWDNPVVVSPATARALNLLPEGYSTENPDGVYTITKYPEAVLADLTVDGRTVRTPVWIMPGVADNTAICVLGYGREKTGLAADGVGKNFYPLRSSSLRSSLARGTLTARPEAGTYMIVSTQNHWAVSGRTTILRAVDLENWKRFGDQIVPHKDGMYATQTTLNYAEQLGELSHGPPNQSIYENPYNESLAGPKPGSTYSKGQQWAMTIDQQLCTGCGACTIACQSENNIPVVGKKETAKGREMTWIRVDRYFAGDDFENPSHMFHQPVACVHCENAPCETVCPVNATVHGPEGINYMVYNRCIGTRYCANNCPYKVRRFNFFEYGWHKFNGGYYFKDAIESVAPDRGGITGSGEHNKINPNLIPPRLRQKLDEVSRMHENPDVTVRSRGVMEKCSYCIQRINAARHETRLDGLDSVPDGYFQTACQQACPTSAITFGDGLDETTRVAKNRAHARSYLLLGYLNTRPRTSHMVRVMNPNPSLCDPERVKSWEHNPAHHAATDAAHESSPGEPGHAPESHEGQSSLFSPRKREQDRGYARSLRVLGDRA